VETTRETLTVDGVVLNTLAKNIESLTGRLRTPPKRTQNIRVPGRHGTIRTNGKKFDENIISLPMWVVGSDDDGRIPTGETERAMFFSNVDQLSRLFIGRDTELDVRHTLPDESVRQCFADVLDAIDFTTDVDPPVGKFGVNLVVSRAFWQDLDSTLQSKSALPASVRFQRFAGATAPMEDLVATIVGPWNAPRLTFDDGSWVQYNHVFGAGEGVVIDSGSWSLSGVGGHVPSLTKLTYYGMSSHWISVPATDHEDGPRVTFTGADRTAESTLTLQGRRKFLVG
jgi:hypothetical protein